MDTFYFRKLDVYQRAKDLALYGYHLLDKYPKVENYALCDQLRRSLISVPSNIAEGMGRLSAKEKTQFLSIAYGSLMESLCQFEMSFMLDYITAEEFQHAEDEIRTIAKELSGLSASISRNTVGKP